MESIELKYRKAKCCNSWYSNRRSSHNFPDNPASTAVISPHAGFIYSGMTSLKAVSKVKKNRIWFFGTSHYESISKGLSVFPGDYHTSIGKSLFPKDIDNKDYNILKNYFSVEGHRTEEHSIENVLYAVNHFAESPEAFCGLVRISDKGEFENISDDIAAIWKDGDSIIVSTDWNHFVSVKKIDKLMEGVSELLNRGNIEELYNDCKKRKYEACGIDSLYLAGRILEKVGEKTSFDVLEATNSAKAVYERINQSETCVGYLAAKNIM